MNMDILMTSKERRDELVETAVESALAPARTEERVTLQTGDQLLQVTRTALQDVEISPADKLAEARRQQDLAGRAEVRQELCWMREGFGCQGKASYHVREVKFDLREADAEVNSAFVSTDDYPGPVPGFCMGCIATGPIALAEAVYKSRPEIQWGFRPNRWFVVFTDGTSQGGTCHQIDMHHVAPKFVHDHL